MLNEIILDYKNTFFMFIVSLIIHVLTTYITHRRIKQNKQHFRKPLYDVIHNNTNNYSNYAPIVDLSTLIFMLPFIKSYGEKRCIEVSSFFIGIFSILMILRSFALLMTDMPSCDENCNPHNLNMYNVFFGHCHDKIFSGHSTFSLLAVLVAYKYNYLSKGQFMIMIALQMIYALSVIITRGHYTVDVLLSYYITIPIFYSLIN